MEKTKINNDIYNELGSRWYEAADNPVALLRRESETKNPWVWSQIQKHFDNTDGLKLLDVGCGAGFLTNYLAQKSLNVTGIDTSTSSLEIATLNDPTASVNYINGDALELPFESQSFDIVTSMDFLEHVEEPEAAIAESARVLKDDGLFIFHTFNRNALSYLIVIRGMEWFVKNTPQNLHLYRLFIKPRELTHFCRESHLEVQTIVGLRPKFDKGLWKLIRTGEVDQDLGFKISRSDMIGYLGSAKRKRRRVDLQPSAKPFL